MANEVTAAFARAWRDYVTDGVASSGANKVSLAEARSVGEVIQALIDQLFSAIAAGFALKQEVRAASTANVTLSSIANGSSFGGVTVATGDRIAPVGQTTGSQNGIYIVQASGAPVRATDADAADEVKAMAFFVTAGTHAGKVFACTTPAPIVVGTTALDFRLLLDMSTLNATLATKASQAALDAEIARATAQENLILKQAVGDGLLDTIYADAAVDEEGRVLIGYRHDGVVDVNDTYPLLNEEYAYAEAADLGNGSFAVLWGLRHDGTLYPGGAGSGGFNSATWIAGGEVIVYANGKRSAVTFSSGSVVNANPYVSGNFVTYVIDNGTTVTTRTEEIVGAESFSGSVTSVVHSLLYGQSLSEGTGGTPAIHTSAVRTGRAAMFSAGVRTRGAASAALVVPDSNMYSLVDLLEADQEGPGCGLGWGLTRSGAWASTVGSLISAHGRGGQPYDVLKKGSQTWLNMIAAIKRARVIASLNGLAYSISHMSWIHGEANVSDSKATYKAYLAELQNDLQDFKALAGQTPDIILAVDQISNWTAYGLVTSQIPYAQLEAALDNPIKVICVGPKYHLPTVGDGVHLTAASYARWGSYHARAVAQHINTTPWKPLYCTGASRVGAVITLAMNVPVGPLVIDTSAVSDPGNNGITWTQTGGTARTISSVAVSGNNIVVTLSGDPGAFSAASIGIAAQGAANANAGPTTGPRSNFRDSATETDIDGNVMRNWACHQLITIT